MTYEAQFKAKYPYAHHTVELSMGTLKMFTVYAGDYVCATACTKERAYRAALKYEAAGFILPDPEEMATTK